MMFLFSRSEAVEGTAEDALEKFDDVLELLEIGLTVDKRVEFLHALLDHEEQVVTQSALVVSGSKTPELLDGHLRCSEQRRREDHAVERNVNRVVDRGKVDGLEDGEGKSLRDEHVSKELGQT